MPVAIRVIIVSSPCPSERAADETNGHAPHQTTTEVRAKLRSPDDSPKGGTSSRPNSDVPSGEYMMIGTGRIADPMNRRSMSCTMCSRCPACASGAWWFPVGASTPLVMGASVRARHPVHFHTALAGACRPQLDIDRCSCRRTAAVNTIQAGRDEVHGPANAHAGGEPCNGPDGALKPERERADIVRRASWR